ncbi:cupin domain-containing protein [Staphylococcus saprophyticus]|nr:cupin domain-containing protein [Staphylococcus saprophyticus]
MKPMSDITVSTLCFIDDGTIPNNPTLPVLTYHHVLGSHEHLEKTIISNQWGNTWTGGVFSYHHYHSNAHETLLVIRGEANLLIGGRNGSTINVTAGDVLILPAGTGHKLLNASHDFTVMGAYPNGQSFDICTGDKNNRTQDIMNIENVPLPETDPLWGEQGPLLLHWH